MADYGCWGDKSLSKYLKCIIKQGEVSVTGKLPEGYTTSLSHNWVSPFQDDSPGSVFPKTAAVTQAMTGHTTKGYLNSVLTWENSEPQSLSLPLAFSAFKNPKMEVDEAVIALQTMSSPSFFGKAKRGMKNLPWTIGNRIPQSALINIGGKFILQDCVIDSVEVSDPMMKTQDGLSLKMSVTLNIRTRLTQDRVDIAENYHI